MSRSFLTASWINLLMANFVIDKTALEPYCPAFTEIDEWNGRCYVSLVGFLFKDTRVMGIRFPYHTNFEEVNLRFYVRYKQDGEWKRGVVFIKELVPKSMITLIANSLYSENYETRQMKHSYQHYNDLFHVEYQWKVNRDWNFLKVSTSPSKEAISEGSEEQFITEHYWGYTKVTSNRTSAYEVRHPKWNIHPVKYFAYECSIRDLYGEQFVDALTQKPTSVFLADGSEISVMNNSILR